MEEKNYKFEKLSNSKTPKFLDKEE